MKQFFKNDEGASMKFNQEIEHCLVENFKYKIENLDSKTVNELQSNNVWSVECPVKLERLKKVSVSYINFSGDNGLGDLVVFDVISQYVVKIFECLYEHKFPINKIEQIQKYGGDDDRSMSDNNSSAFNGRKIMNTNRWSSHAYGMAIDINPVQNPYLKVDFKSSNIKVIPGSGIKYVNRISNHLGMVEEIVETFQKYGFSVWGGVWEDRIDYHHFQVDWSHIENLVHLDFNEGLAYYKKNVLKTTEKK